jgi:N-acetylmuramoyl-L-alanine amidase
MIDLKLVALNEYDSFGFKMMQLQWRNNGKVVDAKPVMSGSGYAQRQKFIFPTADWSGSGNPIPEGVYNFGRVERGNFGPGLGNIWVDLIVQKAFHANNRSAFGLHDDENRATSRGSAGCVVTRSKSDLEHIVKWLESDAKPIQLVVDWELGFLKSRGYVDPTPSVIVTPAPKPTLKRLKIMLERGHGAYPGGWEPGALAHGVNEYDLNGIAVEACRAELVKAGFDVSVNDSGESLHQIGTLAKGFDAFVSFHHNAFNGSAQGSETLILQGNASKADIGLAMAIQAELVKDLGFPNRGVKEQSLGVLRGAESTDVKACCLVEGYFMDALTSGHKGMSHKYGLAVAKGILKWAS